MRNEALQKGPLLRGNRLSIPARHYEAGLTFTSCVLPFAQEFFAFAESWCHVEADGAGNGDARKKKDKKATEATHTQTHTSHHVCCLFGRHGHFFCDSEVQLRNGLMLIKDPERVSKTAHNASELVTLGQVGMSSCGSWREDLRTS